MLGSRIGPSVVVLVVVMSEPGLEEDKADIEFVPAQSALYVDPLTTACSGRANKLVSYD